MPAPLSHDSRRRASSAQPPHGSRRRASSARPLSRPLPEHVPEPPLASTRIPLEGDRGGSRAFFSRFWTLAPKFRGAGRSRAVGPSVFPGHENSHSACAGILPPQASADLGISTQVSIFRRFPCTQAAPITRPAPPSRRSRGHRRAAAGGRRRRAATGGAEPASSPARGHLPLGVRPAPAASASARPAGAYPLGDPPAASAGASPRTLRLSRR